MIARHRILSAAAASVLASLSVCPTASAQSPGPAPGGGQPREAPPAPAPPPPAPREPTGGGNTPSFPEGPSGMASAPPPGSTSGMPNDKPADPGIPAEHTVGLEFGFGSSTRLGTPNTGLPISARSGIGYHIGGFWGPNRYLAVGLEYAHSAAGTESVSQTNVALGDNSTRTLQSLLLELRGYPVNGRIARIYLGLFGGLGWENLDHTGTTVGTTVANPVPVSFSCSASGSGAFAFGGAVGGDFELGSGFAFLLRAAATNYRLPSDALGDSAQPCGRGSGSSSVFEGQVGFAYRFGLPPIGGDPKPAVAMASPR